MPGSWPTGSSGRGVRLVLGFVAAIAAFVAAAVALGGGSETPLTSAELSAKRTVVLRDGAYRPSALHVVAGTRVTWVNRNVSPATVEGGRFNGEAFDLHTLRRGEAETVRFTELGRYEYYSSYDASMRGVVVVEPRPPGERGYVAERVTRDFGRRLLSAAQGEPLAANPTVLRLLQRHTEVVRSESGRTVEAIDRVRRRLDVPEERSWVFYVNGIEADEWAHEYRLHDGDIVQWDLRDWYVTLDVRATVGAFPETFTRGAFGGRFPVEVLCEKPRSDACQIVEGKLRAAGVAPDGERPHGPSPPARQPQRATVLVGRWDHWRRRPWPARLDVGPDDSGVFARFTRDGKRLQLLDWNDRVVRSVGAGTGLVAAHRPTEEDLQWFVTGVDDSGVARAARALDRADLRDAYSIAVTSDRIERLPLPPVSQ